MFQEYQKTTETDLSATIELLEHTSILIEVFEREGTRSFYSPAMEEKLNQVVSYFDAWKAFTQTPEDLPTAECLWDLNNSICGMIELATKVTSLLIRPAYINSDLVELHFSQVRHLFNNSTPNILQYQSIQNSVILGQKYTFANKKTNSGICYPKPMSMYCN